MAAMSRVPSIGVNLNHHHQHRIAPRGPAVGFTFRTSQFLHSRQVRPEHCPKAHAAAVAQLAPRPTEPAPILLQPDGSVLNTADISKVPASHLPLLRQLTQLISSAAGENLVGIYLRGSLPQGRFIDGISDIDTYCIVLADPTTATAAAALNEAAVKQHLLKLGHSPHLVSKVEVVIHQVPAQSCLGRVLRHMSIRQASRGLNSPADLQPPAQAQRHVAGPPDAFPPALMKDLPAFFILKAQSICLQGLDLPALLPAAAAMPPPPSMTRLGEGVEAALSNVTRQPDSEDAVAALRWALKTCLRTAGALAAPAQGVYSRDLYWCNQLAAGALPRLAFLLQQALQLYLDLLSDGDKGLVQDGVAVVEQLRVGLYRAYLRQMLTPEADWLPHHLPTGADGSLVGRLQSLGQLLVSVPAAAGDSGGLVGAAPPVISVRAAGAVEAYQWSCAEAAAAATKLIHSWSQPLNAVVNEEAAWQLLSSRPIVVRGAAVGWPAVREWSIQWLEQQGFKGRVKVAPSLQFPFCEPALLEMLVEAKGPAGAPSVEVRMSVSEFVARMRPGKRPPPLVYPAGEFYYMQAELSPQLLQMTRLDLPPFVAAAPPGGTASTSCAYEGQPDGSTARATTWQAPTAGTTTWQAPTVAQVPRLWLSAQGSVSPMHYDESHSFLVQVHGQKRMLFWPPEQLPWLYLYPEEHLLRRRSRVNLARPDTGRFPMFQLAEALEVVLEPGDVVFFPARWAHYTESLAASVSVTCRYQSGHEEAVVE